MSENENKTLIDPKSGRPYILDSRGRRRFVDSQATITTVGLAPDAEISLPKKEKKTDE